MQNDKLNFIFFGTPDVASETLDILKQNGFVPSLIVTSIDKPKGRKWVMTASPVKLWAIENNIPYLQPKTLDEEFINKIKSYDASLFIIVAYGKIIPENLINTPKLGSINIHYSLLPKYRGASPVESAILNGEKNTGISIQKMEYKLDSGPLLIQKEIQIEDTEKAPDLRKRLVVSGANLLVQILPDIIEDKITPIPQDEQYATYCKKIKKEDGLVDLALEMPEQLYNKYRAYALWPKIYFFNKNKRVIITDALLEDNQFKILKVLPEGKKEITWNEYELNY